MTQKTRLLILGLLLVTTARIGAAGAWDFPNWGPSADLPVPPPGRLLLCRADGTDASIRPLALEAAEAESLLRNGGGAFPVGGACPAPKDLPARPKASPSGMSSSFAPTAAPTVNTDGAGGVWRPGLPFPGQPQLGTVLGTPARRADGPAGVVPGLPAGSVKVPALPLASLTPTEAVAAPPAPMVSVPTVAGPARGEGSQTETARIGPLLPTVAVEHIGPPIGPSATPAASTPSPVVPTMVALLPSPSPPARPGPTRLAVISLGAQTVTLSWGAPNTTEVIRYAVFMRRESDTFQSAPDVIFPTATSAQVSGLRPTVAYAFYVVGVFPDGSESLPSNTTSALIPLTFGPTTVLKYQAGSEAAAGLPCVAPPCTVRFTWATNSPTQGVVAIRSQATDRGAVLRMQTGDNSVMHQADATLPEGSYTWIVGAQLEGATVWDVEHTVSVP